MWWLLFLSLQSPKNLLNKMSIDFSNWWATVTVLVNKFGSSFIWFLPAIFHSNIVTRWLVYYECFKKNSLLIMIWLQQNFFCHPRVHCNRNVTSYWMIGGISWVLKNWNLSLTNNGSEYINTLYLYAFPSLDNTFIINAVDRTAIKCEVPTIFTDIASSKVIALILLVIVVSLSKCSNVLYVCL